jgi:hypothetical protein
MSYIEPVPSCFRNFGNPDTIRELIFGTCTSCPKTYPCSLKTDYSERGRCSYIIAEVKPDD